MTSLIHFEKVAGAIEVPHQAVIEYSDGDCR
jgi:hypothetical protein